MYDETGENLTGYTFELSRGYVAVTAYADMPDLILEWSDTAAPYYAENLEVASDTENVKILCTGMLSYYLYNGETTIQTVAGEAMVRADVVNEVTELRNVDNVKDNVLVAAAEAKLEAIFGSSIVPFADANTPGGFIIDLFESAGCYSVPLAALATSVDAAAGCGKNRRHGSHRGRGRRKPIHLLFNSG